MNWVKLLFISIICATTLGCAVHRDPIPPGTVPEARQVTDQDEQYGREVYQALRQQYELDRNRQHVARVNEIMDRLAAAAGANHQKWHTYLFKDDNIKNAAATRGNYIFVWSGMFKAVADDAELSAVLAHEMGHILAQHTTPTSGEQTNQAIAVLVGAIAQTGMVSQGYAGADLVGQLVAQLFQATLVNPHSQELELEADHIGLFLMARGGYDPERAVLLWERLSQDPDFANDSLHFLSSHPPTRKRLANLRQLLPDAKREYLRYQGTDSFTLAPSTQRRAEPSPTPPPVTRAPSSGDFRVSPRSAAAVCMVQEHSTPIYAGRDEGSTILGYAILGDKLPVRSADRRWLEVSRPRAGFVLSRDCALLDQSDN